MIRRFVRSLIQNATVTHADSSWPVSLRADRVLLDAIGVQPMEEVEIVNIATGERFTTWVEPGAPGEVRVHAGTSHHVRAGDVITIISWGLLHDGQTLTHQAPTATLDPHNRLVKLRVTPENLT